jgi:hypothetical protein
VAAGPVANLVLAVLLYALVNWIGVQEPRALLSPPVAGSLAEKAGLQGGELVRQAALAGEDAGAGGLVRVVALGADARRAGRPGRGAGGVARRWPCAGAS